MIWLGISYTPNIPPHLQKHNTFAQHYFRWDENKARRDRGDRAGSRVRAAASSRSLIFDIGRRSQDRRIHKVEPDRLEAIQTLALFSDLVGSN